MTTVSVGAHGGGGRRARAFRSSWCTASAAPPTLFQPQMAALRGYRVIRLDLPGAGRSPLPHEPLTIEG